MSVKIQIKRDTTDNLLSYVPISGEPVLALDTNILKIGDGVTSWNNLSTPEVNDLTHRVTWANVPNDNITESSVVQHSGALQLTESQIVDLQPYLLNVIEDTTPQLGGDLDGNNFDISGVPNLTATSGNFDVLSFDFDYEASLTKAQFAWDDTQGTMDIGLTDNTAIHIGEHRYFRVRNTTGSPLYKGQVVYATGVHSNGLITPDKYVADGTIREIRFMGVMLETINDGNNGHVLDFGHIEDLDLDGSATNFAVGNETWQAGDILYVHPTASGKLTNVEPEHSIVVALILDTGNGNGNGKMFVRSASYGHLEDNHDVQITNVASGDGLIYNSSSHLWENVAVPKSDITGIVGNASGVYNIVVVDSGTYSSITKNPNTIYFVQ